MIYYINSQVLFDSYTKELIFAIIGKKEVVYEDSIILKDI